MNNRASLCVSFLSAGTCTDSAWHAANAAAPSVKGPCLVWHSGNKFLAAEMTEIVIKETG